MPAYLITGSPGVGKTSIIEELAQRGYAAYNTDDYKDITWFDDILTGKPLLNKPPEPFDDSRYSWNWRLPALQKLMKNARIVFLGGITTNTIENLHLFDRVFVLHISVDTLKKRLTKRTNNPFGKHPKELQDVLSRHKGSDKFWKSKGAIIIDADQSIAKVVDDILEQIADDN